MLGEIYNLSVAIWLKEGAYQAKNKSLTMDVEMTQAVVNDVIKALGQVLNPIFKRHSEQTAEGGAEPKLTFAEWKEQIPVMLGVVPQIITKVLVVQIDQFVFLLR